MRIDENHQLEQYFFDRPTIDMLADVLVQVDEPCCLCVPMVARELNARGRAVTLLEADKRFADIPGFTEYDLYRPRSVERRFDLILCDPPFNRVLLSQLFTAIRVLARGSFAQPLLLAWPADRASDLIGTFAPFGLRATGVVAGYRSVKDIPENRIELFTNMSWSGPS